MFALQKLFHFLYFFKVQTHFTFHIALISILFLYFYLYSCLCTRFYFIYSIYTIVSDKPHLNHSPPHFIIFIILRQQHMGCQSQHIHFLMLYTLFANPLLSPILIISLFTTSIFCPLLLFQSYYPVLNSFLCPSFSTFLELIFLQQILSLFIGYHDVIALLMIILEFVCLILLMPFYILLQILKSILQLINNALYTSYIQIDYVVSIILEYINQFIRHYLALMLHNNKKHRKSEILFDNAQICNQNNFKTINSSYLNNQDAQKKAQQSLLQIQYDPQMDIKNPQTKFMILTRNIKFNNFQFDKNERKRGLQEDFMPLNKFRKTKSTLHYKNKSQKQLKSVFNTINKSQIPYIGQRNIKKQQIDQKMQTFLLGTKSNLLTPRQFLPTIYSSQNNYSVLTRKMRPSLKPYSTQKNSNMKSTIKLRQQLNLFPSIQKQLKKRNIAGYI